jgi:hypothetical protein
MFIVRRFGNSSALNIPQEPRVTGSIPCTQTRVAKLLRLYYSTREPSFEWLAAGLSFSAPIQPRTP